MHDSESILAVRVWSASLNPRPPKMIFPALIFWSQIAYVDTCTTPPHTHTPYQKGIKIVLLKYPLRSGCRSVISTDIEVKLEGKHVTQSD
jgi:hypothetical protein